MIAVLAFLKSPIGKYLLIGLAVLGLLGGFYLKGRGDQHKSDVVTLQKVRDADALALGTCHTNTATLQAALDAQGARVEALGAESQARVAQSQKQAQNARAVAESYRQSAGTVMRAKPGVDACQSADELIAASVR